MQIEVAESTTILLIHARKLQEIMASSKPDRTLVNSLVSDLLFHCSRLYVGNNESNRIEASLRETR
jgi:hypothetical protein